MGSQSSQIWLIEYLSFTYHCLKKPDSGVKIVAGNYKKCMSKYYLNVFIVFVISAILHYFTSITAITEN